MIKVSEAASLALHTACVLAANPDKVITTTEIASALQVSENHLSKVLQRMAKVGLVKSIRGPKGGFMLNRLPDEVTLLEVYEAIEGPLAQTTCLLDRPVCVGQCILGSLLLNVNSQIRDYFASTKLSALSSLNGVCCEPG